MVITLLITVPAAGEKIRALIVDEVHVQTESEYKKTVDICLEEMAAVYIEGDSRFLMGLKIELLLSNQLKKYFDSFGLAIYKKLSQPLKKGIQTLTGERAFFHHLPHLNRIYIAIPVVEDELNGSPLPVGSFRLDKPVYTDEFPILISIIPIMKGIPNSVIDKRFFLTVSPIIEKKGLLELFIQHPSGSEDEPIELFIDDQLIENLIAIREIESGIHHLRVKSSAFKEVNATFTIESGKTNRVEILLEAIASLLFIEAPQGAEVYLDGEKLVDYSNRNFRLDEGDHIVRIKVGDYSLSKRFSTKKGKNYHLSCIFDILINED